ncbi:MAG: helix-turn-helix transcriptional regulator [Acidobacteria bacterium]|nr:helix-turn-helix transcriptional regulator [Acidobacteriota bacterium]
MLYFDIVRLMEMRGVDKPFAFLKKIGFSNETASKIVQNRLMRVSPELIEALCLALNCTPNDVFGWRPSKLQMVPENHALQKLNRRENRSFNQMVNDLPLEKMGRLAEMIDQLKTEE